MNIEGHEFILIFCYFPRCCDVVREGLRAVKKEYAKTEDDLKSLQSVGQIIGEVLRPLDNERRK